MRSFACLLATLALAGCSATSLPAGAPKLAIQDVSYVDFGCRDEVPITVVIVNNGTAVAESVTVTVRAESNVTHETYASLGKGEGRSLRTTFYLRDTCAHSDVHDLVVTATCSRCETVTNVTKMDV